MPREIGPIDELHEELFGFIPGNPGTAYERLTAIVLAGLGWTEVQQQSREQPHGATAIQTLDVVARHPSGEQRRLIVQCKHYAETVGKGVMDTLVGIGSQLGDIDLAVVTMVGFTQGARAVAVDRNIAMVRLRPYDPVADEGSFIRSIEISLYAVSPPVTTNFKVEVGSIEGDVNEGEHTYNTLTPLQKDDGTAGESLAEVMQANGGGLEEGEFDRRVELPERRWLVAEGGRAEIKALSWHETIRKGEPTVTVVEGEGDPVLVLQQLDENGATTSGRLVVDRHLWAWDLDDQNSVVPRGPLD
jgi:hypothetical protein